ncbi:uncharacterized protein LOC131622003 [Vicia villosa]|uniref:uncharacterized protein LOC131622003 n=1 Tax=Vicia villosa TaxID=3911 RepID=UPI00273CBF89|nr:uncharacterized protein LOC131622003 [Vicia villosa]
MECFHWMKKKVVGKRGMMAVKLDMSKAYDRIEWDFVTGALEAMGFPVHMIHLIKRCISTVSYQILLNDDSLIFARANQKEAEVILTVLYRYQRAPGQMVNIDKSQVSFSKNLGTDTCEMVRQRLGMVSVVNHGTYLGLPVILGRSKKEVFGLVIDRVWKKIKGWKENFLSKAGKEILLKAVAQAIPNYVMSCYKLPEGICKEIESLLAKFWWGAKDGVRKMHWMSWERLSLAKCNGGMGFRGIGEFNKSLLGKQYWRLLNDENSLLARVFKGKYYPRGILSEAKVGFSPSYAWRSLLSAKEMVESGTRWRIGDGSKVRIWHDNWIPTNPGFKALSPIREIEENARVNVLIDADLGRWNTEFLNEVFNQHEAAQIASIPLSSRLREDKRIWHYEKDGEYSVKSAHHYLKDLRRKKAPGPSSCSSVDIWKKLWKVPIDSKIKNCVWRAGKNILPTRSNLLKKGISLDPNCPFCCSALVPGNTPAYFPRFFEIQIQFTALWKIWQARNLLIFQNKRIEPMVLAGDIYDRVAEFNSVFPQAQTSAKREDLLQAATVHAETVIIATDAGCFEEGFAAMGCVIRKGKDNILVAACKKDFIQISVSTAEALALKWAMKMAADLSLDNIVFFSDAQFVVDCINGCAFSADLEPIVIDCRSLLCNFNSASVLFWNRNCNSEAHHMVGVGRNLGNKTWLGVIPSLSDGPSCIRHSALLF